MDRSQLERLRQPHPRQREIDTRAAQLLRSTARLTRPVRSNQHGEALNGRLRPAAGER